MSYPTFKIICLAFSAVGYYISFTSPNAAPDKKETYDTSSFYRVLRPLVLPHKAIACTVLIYEALTVFAVAYPSTPISPAIQHALCPTQDTTRLLSVPPTFTFGTGLLFLGILIRVWCFRTLGTLFTFELTIRPNHTLRTDGPYAFVRHPSYIAATLVFLGFILVHSATSECASAMAWYAPVMGIYFSGIAWVVFMLWGRGSIEDRKLRETFGREWEVYRERVPWGFVPFVY
ncbi:hypothetical protein K488DRAFT_84985 [Vararia minispora EC-137]|uniref:Uncharacterized protein n=1 Tax=Vararia minispora EC-137 TaxID=1314806 RepID=A0ACB8QND0_9AGAM|nr:hypothetical protein K488DRAFT_84985 [Vararia minispora EC-137]